MSTSHHRHSVGSTGSPPPRIALQDHTLSWTDDLPVCHLSGVGFATNQIYREDGFRRERHEFEDKSFHFKLDEVYLYGVFDGHEGRRASGFAAQRMPAEILLGQLDGKKEDADVKECLHQAFISVEKGFFESIDDALAERAKIQLGLPEDMSAYDTQQQYPEQFDKLQKMEGEIIGGTTAVVALLYNDSLYVANVGDCRALLCQTDARGVLHVTQLNEEHDLQNQSELQRLQDLGLDVEELVAAGKLGHYKYTRTIGDYRVKGGYKDSDVLSKCTSEPVIAEPDVQGGFQIDDSCAFFIMMSASLYRSLEVSSGTEHVNKDIARMVATEFAVQSTLNGVAQAVVDKVVRIHHDTFMTSSDHRKELCQRRDDITLLIRNFNYPLVNSVNSPTSGGKFNPVSVPFLPGKANGTPISITIPPNNEMEGSHLPHALHTLYTLTNRTNTETQSSTFNNSATYTGSNDSTQNSDQQLFSRQKPLAEPLELDADGKITPYVDFSEFYAALEEYSDEQKEALFVELEPQSSYETIPEEQDEDRSMIELKPTEVAT